MANSESILDGGSNIVLSNTGLISFDGGLFENGENQIKNIDILNTGTITLNGFMRVFQGGVIDTAYGTFETAANSRALIGNTSSIIVGTDTNLTGTGTLDFATGSELRVNSGENFSYDAGDALLLLQSGSYVTGEGTFSVNRDLALGSGNTLVVDNVVSSGTLSLTGGTYSGDGVFSNTGLMQLVATGSDISVDLASYQFENSGTLTLAGGNSAGIHASLAVSDFTNTGTINLVPSEDASGGTLTVGGGTGTLTNSGLINNDVVSGTSFGGAVIEGHIINSGTIYIGSHATSLITDFRPLTITEDLTLTRTSRLVMEMGNGNLLTTNHSAGLDVGGTINFQGTLELRVGNGYDYTSLPVLGSGPQIQADAISGDFHRVLIMNETGTGDANFSLLNKIVIPTFSGSSFHLDTTGLLGSLLGGSGNERLFGGVGDDVFNSGSSGSSVWFGLGGDDSFTLQAGASIEYLDAGQGGRDILYLEESGFTSNADNIWRVNNLEALDFTGAASGTIDMSADFIFGASETSNALISGLEISETLKQNALVIEGNAGQTLSFVADFSEWVNTGETVSVDHDNSGTASSYAIYSSSGNGNVNAFINTNMSVEIESLGI